jgi:thiamine-phosphate pyrophosphorylase
MTQQWLQKPILGLVTNRKITSNIQELCDKIMLAVRGGVDFVQIRENDLPTNELYDVAKQINIAIDNKALVIINDRVDIMLALDLPAVHLTENSLDVCKIKKLVGDQKLITGSAHDLSRAISLHEWGIDLVLAGTMYPSSSHPGKTPEGPDLLESISRTISCPVVGIGGIDVTKIEELYSKGAAGIAVITNILNSADPEEAAFLLKTKLITTQH